MWKKRGRVKKIVDINALKMMINRKAPENFPVIFTTPKIDENFYLFTYLAAFLILSLRSVEL